MADTATTIGQIAEQVRSKNAGPFWITLDVFLHTEDDYRALLATGVISKERIAELYQVDGREVQIYRVPQLRVIKISFPRAVPAGSFEDRDQHAGQQHVPLASLSLPTRPTDALGRLVATQDGQRDRRPK
jgi:hypothetical protein